MLGDNPHPKTVRNQAQPSGWRTTNLAQAAKKFLAPLRRTPMDRRGKHHLAQLVKTLREKAALTRSQAAVWRAIIAHHNDKTGQCCPSYETIAAKADCGRRTVARSNNTLREIGLLSWSNERRQVVRGNRKIPEQTANEYAFPNVTPDLINAIETADANMRAAMRKAAKDRAEQMAREALALPLRPANETAADAVDADLFDRLNATPLQLSPAARQSLDRLATYVRR